MFEVVFPRSYFDVSLNLIQFLTLEQINEAFFNPIEYVGFLRGIVNQEIREPELELEEKYI